MRVIIVGGGTAGWLTASLFRSLKPEHTVTVVESTQIGIIGVGESTTGFFTNVLVNDLGRAFGVTQESFIAETGATEKLGICHKGWTPDPQQSYFGPLDGTLTTADTPDWLYNYCLGHGEPHELYNVSHTGWLLNQGKSNFTRNGKFGANGHGLHIDGTKTGQYFKKRCLARGVEHIDSDVSDFVLDTRGYITTLMLKDGRTVEGDLFIDCSGLHRALIKKMGSGWVSYREHLPVDTAIPFLMPYAEGELPKPYTTAWAQKSGWMWETPLLDRKGYGYVFDSRYSTVEQAQEEMSQLFGQEITPVKTIKFEAGRNQRAWINNCVSIGLSYAFLEPLEATAIHTTICQAKLLIDEYLRPTIEATVNQGSIDLYNKRMAKQYDDLKDFIVLHYQGGRTDTPFWAMISSGETLTPLVKSIVAMGQSRAPTVNDFDRYWGVAGWSLYGWIMAGLGLINREACREDFTEEQRRKFKGVYDSIQQKMGMDYLANVTTEQAVTHFRNLRAEYLSKQQ